MKIYLYLFLLLLCSCSIEKRVHLPGYHVEWRSGLRNSGALPKKTIAATVPERETEQVKMLNVSDYVLPPVSDSVLLLDEPVEKQVAEPVEDSAPKGVESKAKRVLHRPATPLLRSKKPVFKNFLPDRNETREAKHNIFGWIGLVCLLTCFLIYPVLLAPIFGAIGIAMNYFFPHIFKSTVLIWLSYILGIAGCIFMVFFSLFYLGASSIIIYIPLAAIVISTLIVMLSKVIVWLVWGGAD